MAEPVVRPFRAQTDFRAILDSQCDLYEINFPRFRCTDEFVREQANRLRQAARRPFEHAIFVLDDQGLVAGFVWIALRVDLTGVFGSIDQVYLAPAYRGQGYGARLMDAAHRYLAEAGVPWGRLFVTADNTRAVRLYERLGYRTIRLEMERPI